MPQGFNTAQPSESLGLDAARAVRRGHSRQPAGGPQPGSGFRVLRVRRSPPRTRRSPPGATRLPSPPARAAARLLWPRPPVQAGPPVLYSRRRLGPPAGRGQAPELAPRGSAGSRAAGLRSGFRVGVRVTRNGAGHQPLGRSQASEYLAAARAAVSLGIHPPRPAFAACKGRSHGRRNLTSHVGRIGQVNGSDGRLGGTVAGGGERLQGEGSCGPDRGQALLAASRPSQSQGRRGPARRTRPDGSMVEGRLPV